MVAFTAFKPGTYDVLLSDTVHEEWCWIRKQDGKTLHKLGLAHPGEGGYTLADGVTWVQVEDALCLSE